MRSWWWIPALLAISLGLNAQDRCGTHPPDEERSEIFERWMKTQQKRKAVSAFSDRTQSTVYYVPVVVHIIHKGEPVGSGFNLSNERIQQQIDILNEDFRRMNPRSASVPEVFQPVEADIEVEFVLARQDPDGFPTNGIVRKQGSKNSYNYLSDDVLLKSESYWPSEDYLNIWVADLNVLGYATFPESTLEGTNPAETNRLLDGVVVDGMWFGINLSTGGSFDSYGQTTTHEIGHFLGLRHIWGDGNSCSTDDFCDDTPTAATDNGGLGSPCTFPGPDSCTEDELPDMFMNFMDYTNDECMSMFTLDQRFRMRTVLENSPRRASLLTSPGLEYPIGILDFDMAIDQVDGVPFVTCANELTASLILQNRGTENINSIQLEYTLDGEVDTYEETGLNLVTGEQFTLLFPLSLTDGAHSLSWTITAVNGTTDENELNDVVSRIVTVSSEEMPAPFAEDFSTAEWLLASPTVGSGEWQFENGRGNVPAFEAPSFDESWLVSPSFSLENLSEAGLFFSLSYGARSIADVLEIRVSDGCTQAFEPVWSARLDTLGFPTSTTAWSPESTDDFSEFFVDLTAFVGESNLRIAFVFTNNGGNNLYLDNVELTNNRNPGQPRLKTGKFLAYPNPAREELKLTLKLPSTQDVRIQLINLSGAVVWEGRYSQMLNHTISVPTHTFFGTFFVRVSGPGIQQTQRILIGR